MGAIPVALSLKPAPSTAGSCPRDGTPLEVARIHLPGWRIAIEGRCPSCGHRYVQDAPSGHGAMYPATLDLDTGELLNPAGADWFSRPLRDTWEYPDLKPVGFTVDRGGEEREAGLLLNCLDPIYGHALLKLLSAPRVIDSAGAATSVVLVPRSLAHLVPPGAGELWVVDEPVRRLGGWLEQLEERLTREIARFESMDLFSAPVQPHPSTFDIERLVGSVEPERAGAPAIALSLRDDRLWGTDRGDEAVRVTELAGRLAEAYPDVAIAVVSPGTPGGLPAAVHDLRDPRPGLEEEMRWLAVLRGADLAIGVHGSNMLLPSALARATLELIPAARWGNILQASLVRETDPLEALYNHRFVYGDDQLADIAAGELAQLAVEVIDGAARFVAHTRGGSVPRVPKREWAAPPAEQSRSRLRARVGGALRRTPSTDRLLDALEADAGLTLVQLDARTDDAEAVLTGDAGAVVIRGLDAQAAPALLDRLAALELRPHAVANGSLVAVRPAGPERVPDVLVALSPAARARLEAAGLVV